MTQPVPPDPLLVEIRDLLREIREVLTPKPIVMQARPMPMRVEPSKRPPPAARSSIG